MAIGAAPPFRSDVGCVGAHVSLLAATVGLFFLERYIQLERISEIGYGPYTSASYLIGLSAVIVMIDLFILRSALKGAARDRIVSLLVPAAFLSLALFILLANPV
jgi:hypothetical protein